MPGGDHIQIDHHLFCLLPC